MIKKTNLLLREALDVLLVSLLFCFEGQLEVLLCLKKFPGHIILLSLQLLRLHLHLLTDPRYVRYK